jgi:Heparinase II/III-like protein
MSKHLVLKLSAALWLLSFTVCAQIAPQGNSMAVPEHPRILMPEGEESVIKQTIASDITWKTTNQFILDECNKLIGKPPVERILIGRRLLDKSREALRRIFFLSYAWRMTSDAKYLERAEKELLAVSAFSDWNPSHFLDVAEMTMAVSIGYDWLYKGLSAESRNIIKEAIIEKGLKPSLDSKNNSWLKASHNWNQVCNAGMTFGALAVFEDQTELAVNIINRAISSIKLPMEDYKPDGAYSEGYGYWGYGTSFNIMFLSAMEKAFGKDYGLTINQGVFKTAGYLENMTGPTGDPFNYSDAGSHGEMHPAMFWFANNLNDASLLWSEKYLMAIKKPDNDRLLPAVMIWSAGITMDKITAPTKKIWVGQGKNPVALMRTSWTDPRAIYLAMKGGSPSVNHGHMDVGSFIMEAEGERWAMDFGMQDYNSLETAGVNLWNMAQNSQRWEVFRYNNFVHNTLTVNNQLQVVGGYAAITSWSDVPSMINAISDITSVYKGQLQKSVRGIAIIDNQYVTVRDEIETLASATVVRWNLLTSAEVSITGKNTAILTKNGKKLTILVKEPASITMKSWSTEPQHKYDAPNPGTVMVGFEATLPANSKTALTVLLLPEGSAENTLVTSKDLDSWPKTSVNK